MKNRILTGLAVAIAASAASVALTAGLASAHIPTLTAGCENGKPVVVASLLNYPAATALLSITNHVPLGLASFSGGIIMTERPLDATVNHHAVLVVTSSDHQGEGTFTADTGICQQETPTTKAVSTSTTSSSTSSTSTVPASSTSAVPAATTTAAGPTTTVLPGTTVSVAATTVAPPTTAAVGHDCVSVDPATGYGSFADTLQRCHLCDVYVTGGTLRPFDPAATKYVNLGNGSYVCRAIVPTSPGLPATGSSTLPIVLAAIAILIGGTLLMKIARRKA